MISPVSASERESKSFDLLAEPVRRWIWQREWSSLRDIQERAIPMLIDNDDDVIVSAATAGGKTEAAFLPLISRVYDGQEGEGFDLVYVGPLRALINDQFRRLEDLCESVEVPVHPWHGDISQGVKARARKDPNGILLITPESLEAMFVLRGADIPRLFSDTQAIVIDELHALLDSERGVHLRSLLTRIELSTGRRIRRVGLSATLGDLDLANEYLRPEAPEQVRHIVSKSDGQELRAQLRTCVSRGHTGNRESEDADPDNAFGQNPSATRAVAEHIFEKLRGHNNLVFAGSRENVEVYSDMLRQMCEDRYLPNEFLPHHASLSREHRGFVEKRLREGQLPVTTVCTSTLELGIDIGNVVCVGQIGAPWSVSALRQRLGRSGRRAGEPAVLRMYTVEPEIDGESHPIERLHLGLIRSIAMLELLLEGWCEPPKSEALHLSTLTHQILSVIAEHGGVSAKRLYAILCRRGPFRSVEPSLFARLLRQLGEPDTGLIEQSQDGSLLLGREGERIVEHYSFYAVFRTPQEYRVIHGSRTLGTLPVHAPIAEDITVIFVGRRWRVLEVNDRDKIIDVVPDPTGKPPRFGGEAGEVHDTVVARMREVLLTDIVPPYLDKTAETVLSSARAAYRQSGLENEPIQSFADDRYLLAPWKGTVGSASLAIVLTALGYRVGMFDGILDVSSPKFQSNRLISQLEEIALGRVDLPDLIQDRANALIYEKFHPFLGDELVFSDALSSRLDLPAVPAIARDLLVHER